jgi:hypothetical protein
MEDAVDINSIVTLGAARSIANGLDSPKKKVVQWDRLKLARLSPPQLAEVPLTDRVRGIYDSLGLYLAGTLVSHDSEVIALRIISSDPVPILRVIVAEGRFSRVVDEIEDYKQMRLLGVSFGAAESYERNLRQKLYSLISVHADTALLADMLTTRGLPDDLVTLIRKRHDERTRDERKARELAGTALLTVGQRGPVPPERQR